MSDDAVDTVTDFAVAAYLEEGAWTVAQLPLRAAGNLEGLVAALRQFPAEGGAIGLVSVADDFFLALRVRGADVRGLLSDATAVEDWPLAREALEALDLPEAEADDDEPVLAGDVELFADLGLPAMELVAICSDVDAYPDEQLGNIAERLGFGVEFDRAVDGTL